MPAGATPGTADQRTADMPAVARPRLVSAAAAATGFVGATAVGGGIEMLLFPAGNGYVPGAWLNGIPLIDSWVLPGLVLGVGFGVGGVVTAYGLLRRPAWRAARRLEQRSGRHWSWLGTLALGVGLQAWVALEMAVISQRSPLEALYAGLGFAMVALPLTPSVQRYLSVTAA